MMNDRLIKALSDLDETKVTALVKEELDAGTDPMTVHAACREGMAQVGKRYESGEYYVSDLIMAGEIFKQAGMLMGSNLRMDDGPQRGKVVIGTVKGDIHDIGKDLVVSMLRANGYDVTDLGVDIPSKNFVEALEKTGAAVLGLSGLLTIAFDSMKETIAAVNTAGLRSRVKVMIGGGSINEKVREYVGADAVGADAQEAVVLCNGWIPGEVKHG